MLGGKDGPGITRVWLLASSLGRRGGADSLEGLGFWLRSRVEPGANSWCKRRKVWASAALHGVTLGFSHSRERCSLRFSLFICKMGQRYPLYKGGRDPMKKPRKST